MTTTPNLSLPYLESGQAQKHVTHNEALRMLDALVMLTVLDRDLSAPPAAPADGARYIVKAPGSGAFAGKDNQIAHYIDGGWLFHPPRAGWTCYVEDEYVLAAFDGAGWIAASAGAGGREVLAANRTYYVRTDGSDSNDGLANTAGGAFLTIQKAIDVTAALDCSIYNVVISVAQNGTYAPFTLKSFLGSGLITITGDVTTPSNRILSATDANCINGSNAIGRYKVEGFKTTVSGGSGSACLIHGCFLTFGVMDFGAAATSHIWAEQNSYVEFLANYTISGGATRHLFATTGAVIVCAGKTVTLTGTPNFSTAFAVGSRLGVFTLSGNTYSGSATGARYILSTNAAIDAGGGTLPGSSAGSLSTGGQYL